MADGGRAGKLGCVKGATQKFVKILLAPVRLEGLHRVGGQPGAGRAGVK